MFPLSHRIPSLIPSVLILVAFASWSRVAYSLPLETFREPLSIDCGEGQRECAGVLRVSNALGQHTGISIVKGLEGEVSVRAGHPKGTLKIQAEDVSDLSISFSWDGDSNPEVLSGSGLNCRDLTRGGAYAFILSKFSAEPECREAVIASECPQFAVESRVYDSQDPTGQRFSASVMVRGVMVDADLAIPFSNFVRSGPRGKGNFTCVGAVTVTIKFSGLEGLDLELGPIYTNGEEGQELPPTPTAPTPTQIPSATEPVKIEPAAIPAILAMPDVIATVDPKAGDGQTPEAQAESQQSMTHSATAQSTLTQPIMPLGTAAPVAQKADKAPEEVVYGSVVIGE